MVRFENSVNMAKETKKASKIFLQVLLTGLHVAAIISRACGTTALPRLGVFYQCRRSCASERRSQHEHSYPANWRCSVQSPTPSSLGPRPIASPLWPPSANVFDFGLCLKPS